MKNLYYSITPSLQPSANPASRIEHPRLHHSTTPSAPIPSFPCVVCNATFPAWLSMLPAGVAGSARQSPCRPLPCSPGGETALKGRLGEIAFLAYWLVCLALTGLAIFIAFLDVRALQRRTRQEHRDLLDSTLKEIETDARRRKSK